MHPLLQQHQHSLLGRLRTKVFARITAGLERLPTARELWRSQMDAWKQGVMAGRIEFHLLHVEEARETHFSAKLSRQEVGAILRHAAGRKAQWRQYVEGELKGVPGSPKVGCLVLGHTRASGEPGYHVAILKEDEFPEACGFCFIGPSREAGKSIISVLSREGWLDLSPTQAGEHINARIALAALQFVPDSKGTMLMPIDQIKIPSKEWPEDPECSRRLNLVFRRRMSLTKATVPRSSVRLFGPEFVAMCDKEIVIRIAQKMQETPRELLVYWDGTRFVSSDDEHSFLAYELLSARQLPVVIMGDFPQDAAVVEQRGGVELMPPILITQTKVKRGETPELTAWQNDDAILQEKRLPPPADLMTNWIIFAEMLSEDDVDERELHDFLDKNAVMMGAHWDSVESEVRFASQYKADFVLRAIRALPTVRLVELERSTHRLFTKDLHETDEVTHAVQQVSDWLRWWRQNPEHPVVAPSRGTDPDGLVVIGRSNRLTEKEREILAHNNQRRNIKVITYDELLDDFGSLILHRLDDTRA